MNRLSPMEAMLLRSVASHLSPRGRRGSLLTLIYHRVLHVADPLLPDEPTADEFATQMDLVTKLFNVLPLSEAVERLKTGSLPERALAITFDDGYANNVEVAAPILAGLGLRATFFIATGFIDGGRMFNDTVIEAVRRAHGELDLRDLGLGVYRLESDAARRLAISDLLAQLKYVVPSERLAKAERIAERVGASLPNNLMMSEEQVRRLAGMGMEIGAHSVTHPILTRVDAAVAEREISESRHRLAGITGQPVSCFAYPNGRPLRDYDASHVAMVRAAGYSASVSTSWGKATIDTDEFQVPRIGPWDRTARRYGLRMLRTYLQGGAEAVPVSTVRQ